MIVDIDDVREVARAIGWPAEKWPGNRYAVSCAIVRAGLLAGVSGKAVYGHWHGEVKEGTWFYDRVSVLGFIPHGWVRIRVLSTDQIYDPTRWIFSGYEPSIWRGYPSDDYDEGGNRIRTVLHGAPPQFDPNERMVWLGIEDKFVDDMLSVLLGMEPMIDGDPRGMYPISQMFWLANQAPVVFGKDVRAVYEAFERSGSRAMIPLDNWRMVMEE